MSTSLSRSATLEARCAFLEDQIGHGSNVFLVQHRERYVFSDVTGVISGAFKIGSAREDTCHKSSITGDQLMLGDDFQTVFLEHRLPFVNFGVTGNGAFGFVQVLFEQCFERQRHGFAGAVVHQQEFASEFREFTLEAGLAGLHQHGLAESTRNVRLSFVMARIGEDLAGDAMLEQFAEQEKTGRV
jgi:hypothetical protein